MSSAFKNFCITFGAGLVVFGLIGWLLIYPAISNISSDTDESSSDSISDESLDPIDTSSDPQGGDTVVTGKTFTAVFIGKANDGLAASVIYMRVNESKQTFTYCFLPTDTFASNNIGKNEPIKYLLAKLDGDAALKKLSSLVGVQINYYAILGMDELAAIADTLTNAKFNIPNEIRYKDPNVVETPWENPEDPNSEFPNEEPVETEIVVPAGNNKLDGDLVRKIMLYNPTNGEEYHVLTKQLYESVFTQFLTDPGTKKNRSVISGLFTAVTNTNLNAAIVEENMNLIFTFDSYKRNEIKYSSNTDWTRIVPLFREDK